MKLPTVSVAAICGRRHQKESLNKESQKIFTDEWRSIIERDDIDGVIVATPPQSHLEIAKYALTRGMPTLVEKPFTLSLRDAEFLANISDSKRIPCIVGYTHLFAPKFQDLISQVGTIGHLRSVETIGLNDGPVRDNVPVLWDWGSHDISMCIKLLGRQNQSAKIIEIQRDSVQKNREKISVNAVFGSNILTKMEFGNIAKNKIRRFTLIGSQKTLTYEGLGQSIKHRTGKSKLPSVDRQFSTPLERQILEFNVAVQDPYKQHSTIPIAIEVTRLLEKLQSQYQSFAQIKELK